MKGSFKLGTIAGIGVFVHWTFSLLMAFIIFSNYQAGHSTSQILWSLVFILSIFFTVFLHELGHALAARKYHIKTRDITLLPIGWLARLESIPENPKEELVVAIAGPAVNIGIAMLTALFITIPDAGNLTLQLAAGVNADNFFLNFFIVNIWLALFNLVPAFPMDGGRVLRAILSMKMKRDVATNIAARIAQFLSIGFIFLGFYANPFLIFIGLFIFLGAQAEAAFTQTKYMLEGYTVKDVVMKNYPTIDADQPVDRAVQILLNGQSKNFLVTDKAIPVGTLSRDDIIRALSENSEGGTVAAVMNRELVFLDADLPLEKAFQQMQQQKSSLLPVMSGGALVGTVDMENILEFVMVKDALSKRR